MSNEFTIKTIKGETLFYMGGRGYHRMKSLLEEVEISREQWNKIKPFDDDEGVNFSDGMLESSALAAGFSEEDIAKWSPSQLKTFTFQELKTAFITLLALFETCTSSETKDEACERLADTLEVLDEYSSDTTFASYYD